MSSSEPLPPRRVAGIAAIALAFAACGSKEASEEGSASRDARSPSLEGMVRIAGGATTIGTDDGFAYEAPVHEVELASFWIDVHEVTVAQFERFAAATGHRTTAEQLGWSGVFDVAHGAWRDVAGADWRHPDGPQSTASPNEPVTQVSFDDARAFAAWAGKRLPTEAEFERALRGGHSGRRFAWGDELTPGGRHMANLWQGEFPRSDGALDGFATRAPVGSFPPNDFGLHDLVGNVWEWCEDLYAPYGQSPDASATARVIRGGSWLCAPNYCQGYRAAARNQTEPDSGLNNLGFRCAADDAGGVR